MNPARVVIGALVTLLSLNSPIFAQTTAEIVGRVADHTAKLTLTSGDRARVDGALEVGALSETVLVTGESPLLQTDASNVSSLVTEKALQELPAGLLVTAGGLLFASDNAGNLVAHDQATGKALWHSRLGQGMNAPETFMLDGKQFVLVASGDVLYSFALY